MVERKFTPAWLRGSEEPLQKHVVSILEQCKRIRHLANPNGDGDQADLEGARDDLRATLEEIFNKNGGQPEENPLWAAMMMIRPQVINGRLPTSVTEEVSRALWDLKNGSQDDIEAEFFGKLAGQLRRHQINFFKSIISGGQLMVKDNNGKWMPHYFPGIPLNIRREVGVRLTTHPDNLQFIFAAYKKMEDETSGYARAALEAAIADIKELSQNLYPPKK